MTNEIITQTDWEKVNVVHIMLNGDISDINAIHYKKYNRRVGNNIFNSKFNIMNRLKKTLYRVNDGIGERYFELSLIKLFEELLLPKSISFTKKHSKIQRYYTKSGHQIYEVHIDNVLLSYIKQKLFYNDDFINVLEERLSETQNNKEKREEEINGLYDMCVKTFKRGTKK